AAPPPKLPGVPMPLNCQPVPDVPDGCQVGGSGLADGLGKVRVYSSVRLGLPRPRGRREATTPRSPNGGAWAGAVLSTVRVYSRVGRGLPRPGGCREATTTGSLSGAAWSVRFAGGGEWCGQ